MQRPMKTVEASRTTQVQIVLSAHVNGSGRLFGGQLVAWIDVVAAVVARRHAQKAVTTATIDTLQFKAGAHMNNTILLDGRVTYVGNTSMEVRVDTYVEHLSGEKSLINTAYLVLVALDENERPAMVPGLLLETPEQHAEWEAGARRRAARKT